jgi:hypothetical protein
MRATAASQTVGNASNFLLSVLPWEKLDDVSMLSMQRT